MSHDGPPQAAPGEDALSGTPEPWERWETSLVLGSIAVGLVGLRAARLARRSVHPAMSARELVLSYDAAVGARAATAWTSRTASCAASKR